MTFYLNWFNLENNEDIMNNCDKIAKEMYEFCSNWNKYMSNTQLEENLLLEAKESLIKPKAKAEKEKSVNISSFWGYRDVWLQL